MGFSKATDIVDAWGEEYGLAVMRAIRDSEPIDKPLTVFLNEDCIADGGNMYASMLSGIQMLRPNVWDAIPPNIGDYPAKPVCAVLRSLGVDFMN